MLKVAAGPGARLQGHRPPPFTAPLGTLTPPALFRGTPARSIPTAPLGCWPQGTRPAPRVPAPLRAGGCSGGAFTAGGLPEPIPCGSAGAAPPRPRLLGEVVSANGAPRCPHGVLGDGCFAGAGGGRARPGVSCRRRIKASPTAFVRVPSSGPSHLSRRSRLRRSRTRARGGVGAAGSPRVHTPAHARTRPAGADFTSSGPPPPPQPPWSRHRTGQGRGARTPGAHHAGHQEGLPSRPLQRQP